MAVTDHLDPQNHPWLRERSLRRVIDAIASGGGETRVVGGAVRDALLGHIVGEIDLAASLPPEKIMEILSSAGIKCVPTGIDHGTVTAVVDHKGYEITTLRRDVETDGRRAKVEYTDNWQADAARRDFTMNALYADANGKIYDYFRGREDLTAGRVRFIGDARARIKEDVLRIMRFFRFTAWFAQNAADADGLAACRELAGSIPTLSAERVWREIIKLLAAENPTPSWQLMKDAGVLPQVLPQAENITRLQSLLAIEQKYAMPPSPLVRLAALLPQDDKIAENIAKQLKISNREADKLYILAMLPEKLKGKLDPTPFRRALYEYGPDACRDAALLLGAENPGSDLGPALDAASAWERPPFPVQGGDVLALGIPAGPKLGELLRTVEEWWISHDFRPNRADCLAELKRHI